MSAAADTYVFELLGKNGEPVVDQQVVFNIYHQGFSRPENMALKTDEKGRIALGTLPGISSIQSQTPNEIGRAHV